MILGLTFIGLRASSAHQAAALSGMAQSVGYLLAACGPPLMGRSTMPMATGIFRCWRWR
jgi:CP family cyanate transporter-like MFS transporter